MNNYPPVIDLNKIVRLEKCHIDDLNDFFSFAMTVERWNQSLFYERVAQLECMIEHIISQTDKFHKSLPYQYFRLTNEEAQKVLLSYNCHNGALYKWEKSGICFDTGF